MCTNDGAIGVMAAPQGRLLLVLDLAIAGGKIAASDVVAEPDYLVALDASACWNTVRPGGIAWTHRAR